MALAVSVHGKGTVGVSSPHDESITVAASTTQLFVGVVWDAAATVSGVTWDQGGTNQAMTSIGTKTTGTKKVHLWGLMSPTTGTKTVRVTYTAAPGGGDQVFWCSFTGGDTSTGWRTVTSRSDADGTGPGLTDANWASGDYELHLAEVGATTITFDAGETAQQSNDIAGSAFSGGLSYDSTDGTVGCTDVATYAEVAVAVMPGGGDVSTGLSGSASTVGRGTSVPGIEVPL